MAINVIQSQNLDILLDAVLDISTQPVTDVSQLFQPKYFIVPNHGIGQWLQQNIAQKTAISANIKFEGLRTFQWELYQQVLGKERVAEAPQMLNMKWRIFLFLYRFLAQDLAVDHPLSQIFQRIQQHSHFITDHIQQQLKQQSMLYWIADQTSRLFTNYMIYRGQCINGCQTNCYCRQNWLNRWSNNQSLNVKDWLRQPEQEIQQTQPHLLQYAFTQAEALEKWQRFIWHEEFATDFMEMQKIDELFWQQLAGEDGIIYQQKLPQQLYLFTLLELPPSQLFFLRRLAQYISITIFHYTPSQEYWADSVDPKWKAKYALKYPDAAVYYESRHPLLTRLGKQARDISALLSQLSGGEEGQWLDYFPDHAPNNLLQKLQSDILHLREPEPQQYLLNAQDQSLQIHVCHSTLRQLEVLKDQLIDWLNTDDVQPRQLDDILVLVPDLANIEDQIRTVFAQNYDVQQVNLPIKIAGVPQMDSVQLWQALILRIKLLQQRFSLDQLVDWLSMIAVQALYQLNFEDIQRMTVLLQQAGFKRGFDQQHLAQSLSSGDEDFRFTFRYALERLTLAIAMPEHAIFANVLSMQEILRSDFELIAKLVQIYQDLALRRDWLMPQPIQQQQDIAFNLQRLRQEIQDFATITGIDQVQIAFDKLQRIIRMTKTEQVKLPLQYLLDEIANTIQHQVAQTEPTGQITFAQIGQLRPLPYRLIVCLNLDSGTFPNRDTHIPFDLMELLRAELGDRSRLDDDQGAFLDALLQAKQAFWLFYNGFDVNDHEIRDPSSIVQELVLHLAFIVQKSDINIDDVQLEGITIPVSLQQLYHIHPLQPFDPKGFIQPEYRRFANQWLKVAEHILQPQSMQFNWLNRDYPLVTQQNPVLDAQQWINQLCFPARHFLRSVGIDQVESLDELEGFESLQLDGLQKYVIRDYLQQQLAKLTAKNADQVIQYDLSSEQNVATIKAINQQLLQDKLPIGKMQNATWQSLLAEYELILERLKLYGGVLSKTTKRNWQFNDQLSLLITVPEQTNANSWLSLTAASCRDERPLNIWLEYLLWRASNDSAIALQRIALFNNVTLIVSDVSQDQAKYYLQQWFEVWLLAQQQPFVLPPALFANLTTDVPKWQFDAIGNAYIENYHKLEDRWLGKRFYKGTGLNKYQDKASSFYPDWALLLIEQDSKLLLNQFTEKYAAKLYQPLSEHIQVIGN